MEAYWDPEFVDPFKPADKHYADPPAALVDCLSKVNSISGSDFREQIAYLPPSKRVPALQKYLLAALRDASLVGKYSTLWTNSIYLNGYHHSETVRLAYMCVPTCMLLADPST